MSESCVNNMTIFFCNFFFISIFCFVVVLKRVFVWEVGFKCFPLSVFPAPFPYCIMRKAEPLLRWRLYEYQESKSDENEPG